MLSEPLLVVARLARTFDDLAIRYLVGGSLASSLYGIPRATQDDPGGVLVDAPEGHGQRVTERPEIR